MNLVHTSSCAFARDFDTVDLVHTSSGAVVRDLETVDLVQAASNVPLAPIHATSSTWFTSSSSVLRRYEFATTGGPPLTSLPFSQQRTPGMFSGVFGTFLEFGQRAQGGVGSPDSRVGNPRTTHRTLAPVCYPNGTAIRFATIS